MSDANFLSEVVGGSAGVIADNPGWFGWIFENPLVKNFFLRVSEISSAEWGFLLGLAFLLFVLWQGHKKVVLVKILIAIAMVGVALVGFGVIFGVIDIALFNV